LAKDEELTSSFAVTVNTVLDLNGHTITNASENSFALVTVTGSDITLKVLDSIGDGEINNAHGEGIKSNNGNSIVVESGKVTASAQAIYFGNSINTNNGTLTINDGEFSGSEAVNVYSGSAEIKGGEFTGSTYSLKVSAKTTVDVKGGTFNSAIYVNASVNGYGTLNISGGTVNGTTSITPHKALEVYGQATISGTAQINGQVYVGGNYGNNKLTVSGGTIISTENTQPAINITNAAEVNITNGTITGDVGIVQSYPTSVVTISGGTITATGITVTGDKKNAIQTSMGTATITGGTLNGKVTSTSGTVSVEAGSFSTVDVGGYVASDSILVYKAASGTTAEEYKVVKSGDDLLAAQEAGYKVVATDETTLTSALAIENVKVILLNNINLESTLNVTKTATIDLNGKTITQTAIATAIKVDNTTNTSSVITLTVEDSGATDASGNKTGAIINNNGVGIETVNGAALTLKDIKVTSEGAYNVINFASDGKAVTQTETDENDKTTTTILTKLTISGGTYLSNYVPDGDGNNAVYVNGGEATITGGTFKGNVYALYVNGSSTVANISGGTFTASNTDVSTTRGICVNGSTAKIEGTAKSCGLYINAGTATIDGAAINGKVTMMQGSLTVESGTISAGTQTAIQIVSGGANITINNGTITGYDGIDVGGLSNVTITVNNGTIIATRTGIKVDASNSVANIYNGTIISKNGTGEQNRQFNGVYVEYGTVNIYGGTISSNSADILNKANKPYASAVYVASGAANIYGGTIGSASYDGKTYNPTYGVYLASGSVNIAKDPDDEDRATAIISGCAGGGVYVKDGTFTMSAGTINESNVGGYVYNAVSVYGGTATISGGNISGLSGIYAVGTTIEVTGGTINGYYHGIEATSSANVAISGDNTQLFGNQCGVYVYEKASATISGGTIEGTLYAVFNQNYYTEKSDNGSSTFYSTAKVTISGGSFSGKLDSSYECGYYTSGNKFYPYSITGGTFDRSVNVNYFAKGYVQVTDTNNSEYKIVSSSSELESGYRVYCEVSTSINFSNALVIGGEIVLTGNIEYVENNNVVEKAADIYLNGHTLTLSKGLYISYGDVTIYGDGGTINSASEVHNGALICVLNAKTLTLDNTKVNADGFAKAIMLGGSYGSEDTGYTSYTGNLVLNNGSEIQCYDTEGTAEYIKKYKEEHNGATPSTGVGVAIFGIGKVSEGDQLYSTFSTDGKANKVYGSSFAVSSNGGESNGYVRITITGTDYIESQNAQAIYAPAISGETTISGGTIKGKTGIELRAGTLVVTGGTISGSTEFSSEANNNGATTFGVAIAIIQHTTKEAISANVSDSVNISGATLNGYYAVYQANPQKNEADAIAKVGISLGNATYNGLIYSENLTEFVTGGTFANAVDMDYIASDYTQVKTTDTEGKTVYKVVSKNDAQATTANIYNVVSSASGLERAAALGGTIIVTADIEVSKTISLTKSTVINGYKGLDEDENVLTYKITTASGVENTFEISGSITANFSYIEIVNDTRTKTYQSCIATLNGEGMVVKLNNVKLQASGSYHGKPLNIAGNHSYKIEVEITNSIINAAHYSSDTTIDECGYGIAISNPVKLTVSGSTISGYGALLLLEGSSSNYGAQGSEINVQSNSALQGYLKYDNVGQNDFAIIAIQSGSATVDTNINIDNSIIEGIVLEGNGKLEDCATIAAVLFNYDESYTDGAGSATYERPVLNNKINITNSIVNVPVGIFSNVEIDIDNPTNTNTDSITNEHLKEVLYNVINTNTITIDNTVFSGDIQFGTKTELTNCTFNGSVGSLQWEHDTNNEDVVTNTSAVIWIKNGNNWVEVKGRYVEADTVYITLGAGNNFSTVLDYTYFKDGYCESLTKSEVTVNGVVGEYYTTRNQKAVAYVENANGVKVGYVSLQEAINATEGDVTIYVVSDMTLDKLPEVTSKRVVTIDLNGYTITSNQTVNSSYVKNGGTLNFVSTSDTKGKISAMKMSADNTTIYAVEKASSISFDNIYFEGRAAVLYPSGNAASVTIKNSEFISNTAYVIATNAATDANWQVVITVENSKITNIGSTAIVVNVPCEVKIINSELYGARAALMVRGGTAEITDSTLGLLYDCAALKSKYPNNTWNESTATSYYNQKNENYTWGTGNDMPSAALVLGNKDSTAYDYATKVTLNNVTINSVFKIGDTTKTLNDRAIVASGLNNNVVTLTIKGDNTQIDGRIIEISDTSKVNIAIEAGKFSVVPDYSNFAAGKLTNEDHMTEDGYYVVEDVDANNITTTVTKANGKVVKYEDLGTAIYYATDGDVISVEKDTALDLEAWDCEEEGCVILGIYNNVTINLNGHTVKDLSFIVNSKDAVLTIKNGTLISAEPFDIYAGKVVLEDVYVNIAKNEDGTYTAIANYDKVNGPIYVAGKDAKLEMKGGAVAGSNAVYVEKGEVKISDNAYVLGTIVDIEQTGYAAIVIMPNSLANVTVENSTIVGGYTGIMVWGSASSADTTITDYSALASTLTVTNTTIYGNAAYGISGNGASHYTIINVTDSTITGGSTGIYNPQYGTLTVSGGTITGEIGSGIEIRAGKLVVKGDVVITSNAKEFSCNKNGNGITTYGAAIAIVQHTTKLPITVSIETTKVTGTDGKVTTKSPTLTGIYSFYEVNVQENNTTADDITISVNGGTYNGLVYSQDETKFIKDAVIYSSQNYSKSDYIADGSVGVYSEPNSVTVIVVPEDNT
jgi:hypothetical protein